MGALPALVAVVLMATRVGDRARFVTWPVVAFTALVAAVLVASAVIGSARPLRALLGVVPGLVVAYVLPIAPMVLVAGVLFCLGGLVVATRQVVAAGAAMAIALGLLALSILPGPAADCGTSSIGTNSGPWWEWSKSGSTSSGSGFGGEGASSGGTTTVGGRSYRFTCEGDRLTTFERA